MRRSRSFAENLFGTLAGIIAVVYFAPRVLQNTINQMQLVGVRPTSELWQSAQQFVVKVPYGTLVELSSLGTITRGMHYNDVLHRYEPLPETERSTNDCPRLKAEHPNLTALSYEGGKVAVLVNEQKAVERILASAVPLFN